MLYSYDICSTITQEDDNWMDKFTQLCKNNKRCFDQVIPLDLKAFLIWIHSNPGESVAHIWPYQGQMHYDPGYTIYLFINISRNFRFVCQYLLEINIDKRNGNYLLQSMKVKNTTFLAGPNISSIDEVMASLPKIRSMFGYLFTIPHRSLILRLIKKQFKALNTNDIFNVSTIENNILEIEETKFQTKTILNILRNEDLTLRQIKDCLMHIIDSFNSDSCEFNYKIVYVNKVETIYSYCMCSDSLDKLEIILECSIKIYKIDEWLSPDSPGFLQVVSSWQQHLNEY